MNPLVSLAKSAVEKYVKEDKIISPPDNLPIELLTKKAGIFVTIEKNGNLRGCIGTYLPTKENIAKEIVANAIAAAIEDYRFGPIQKEELPYLTYTVYILHKLQNILKRSGRHILTDPKLKKAIKTKLNPKKYGIIVKTAPIDLLNRKDVVFNGSFPYKSGLLLPNLESINTAEEQISIACQKGGINPITENIIIYKFTVKKYEEKS